MLVFVWCIIIWLVPYVNSTRFSVNWISTSRNSSQIPGNIQSPISKLTRYRRDVAYMIADISEVTQDQIKDIYKKLSATPFNITTRILY